ncbi:hypothetical protein GH714_040435 [Hevea brasiliensis]|uniref:Ribonuclease n=1 Tax=Hevea brasiliensis TaxID=3981 RepID=A0A6A6N5B3_HEVBR|nr:hypothetical protein GH714_040435 [Hevea brasiliensis]
MATSKGGATGWYSAKVKAVPSGDALVLTAKSSNKPGPPPERTITLSSLIAPRLARRGGVDEPFAWESREFLRKLCIGKDVKFKIDYAVPSIGREFGSVFIDDQNVGTLIISEGWAKVREHGQQKGEASPFLAEYQLLEEQAKQNGRGRWSKAPGAAEASIRNLPPSAIGDPSNLDAMGLLTANKGRPMQGIVEQVRDGSTVRVYLLPDFQFVQVFVAGIQAPSMGRRAASETVVEKGLNSDEQNGDVSEPRAPLTSAQRLAVSTASTEVAPDPFGIDAKYFTEQRVLNRDVRIVLEGVDKFSNLIGSVYYPDGESAKDLALELVENGLAKYVEWSANMMEDDAKRRLKNAELQAKKSRLRIWTNYVPPPTNSKAIHDQNFTGKVNVQMEYSRKVTMGDGPTAAAGSGDLRVMDFGSVFELSSNEGDTYEVPPASSAAGSQQAGVNVAELMVSRGYGTVIRHRDFEERSNYYDALLAAESRATALKRGASAKKARDFLPFLHRNRKIAAVVEYVLSGHRFKLLIPKETCSIAFSFSGVRCPGRDEPYSDEASALMRRRIMQREVEIEVETVDSRNFLGSLWESRTNMAVVLLEAGLAKLQTSFGIDRIPDAHLLEQAEQSAKKKKLKIWENYVEGKEVSNGPAVESKQKEVLKVVVTEVLGGGKFYVQAVGDQNVASIQQQLASLNLQEAPVIDCECTSGAVESMKDKFEVFYIDYGNQEVVTYSQLRPLDPSVSLAPGLAQLCSLAYIKVPSLEEDCGPEAAEYLSAHTLSSSKEFRAKVEERDTSGGKVKGQGTGPILIVTLVAVDSEISVNAAMVQFFQLCSNIKKFNLHALPFELSETQDRKEQEVARERQVALDNLEKFQDEARADRRGIWMYGDIQSDDEEMAPPARKVGGRR